MEARAVAVAARGWRPALEGCGCGPRLAAGVGGLRWPPALEARAAAVGGRRWRLVARDQRPASGGWG